MEPVTQFDTTLVAGNVKAAMRNVQASSRDLWEVNVSDIRILDDFNVRIHDSAWETHIRALANSMKVEGFYQDKPLAGYVAKEGDAQVIYNIHKNPHIGVSFWCGMATTTDGTNLTFLDSPSDDKILCARCEEFAAKNGLPSADSLAGRHVHVGRTVAVMTCCTEAKVS